VDDAERNREIEERRIANRNDLRTKYPKTIQEIEESFRSRANGDPAKEQAAIRAFWPKTDAIPLAVFLAGSVEEWLLRLAEEAAREAGI
jgi:hypothetical protein